MARKFSKAMYKRVATLTNKIFIDSVKEVFHLDDSTSQHELNRTLYNIRYVTTSISMDIYPPEEVNEILKAKERVDELYLNKMLSLSNLQLEEILVVHDKGEIKRMQKTIEAIISELTRRSVFSDTNESDNKYNNGEVYANAGKSPRSGKKAIIKRCKAVKD